jgi:chromosome segregation ATPase
VIEQLTEEVMQIKSIAMLAVAGCAIGMLTGCGVPQKEHDAIVAQLNADALATEDALNITLADTQSLLEVESAKTRKLQIELNDTAERIDELKSSANELTDSLAAELSKVSQLESDLTAVKNTVASAQQATRDAENERNVMEIEKQETQRRFDMLRSALLDLNNKNPEDLQIKLIVDDMGGTPAATESITQSAPAASDTESVKGLLDEMDNM